MKGTATVVILPFMVAAVSAYVATCPLECDRDATCVKDVKKEYVCQCNETLIGDGWPHKCHDIKAVVQARCLYQFADGLPDKVSLPYGEVVRQIRQSASQSNWCTGFNTLEAFLKVCDFEPQLFVSYLGENLTVADCAMVMEEDIICPDKEAVQDGYADSGIPPAMGPFFQSLEETQTRTLPGWLSVINFHEMLMKLLRGDMGLKLVLKKSAISFFDKEEGIPSLSFLHMTAGQARKLITAKKRDVASTFYKEPDLKNQGSQEIYDNSRWDRGRTIASQFVSYNRDSVQEMQSYAFIVPLAPRFNRKAWLGMEVALVRHLKSSFIEDNGQIFLFTGTSNKEIQIGPDENGHRVFSLVEGPKRYLNKSAGDKGIVIPNSLWTLAICVHLTPDSKKVTKLETIAYCGNNVKELSKAITMSIPLKAVDELFGVSLIRFNVIKTNNIGYIHTYFTDVIPQGVIQYGSTVSDDNIKTLMTKLKLYTGQ